MEREVPGTDFGICDPMKGSYTGGGFEIPGAVISRLCGLVVRVPDYRSRGPRSIPRATRLSEK
jgi:hypothetical protein